MHTAIIFIKDFIKDIIRLHESYTVRAKTESYLNSNTFTKICMQNKDINRRPPETI